MTMSSLFGIILVVFYLNFNEARTICEPKDTKCEAQGAYALFVSGVDNLVETSDPLARDLIKASLPTVKYELRDATLSGLKTCDLTAISIDKEKISFIFTLNCPELEVNADYTLLGHIGPMLVQGEDKLKVKLEDYRMRYTGIYEIKSGEDGKKYVYIKNYIIEVDPKGNVVFDFQKLYSGEEEKTDLVNKFLNENWREMDEALRAPTLYSFMDIFIENLNRFLGIYPVEEIFPELAKN